MEPGRVERIREKKRSGSRILTLEKIEDHQVGLPIFQVVGETKASEISSLPLFCIDNWQSSDQQAGLLTLIPAQHHPLLDSRQRKLTVLAAK